MIKKKQGKRSANPVQMPVYASIPLANRSFVYLYNQTIMRTSETNIHKNSYAPTITLVTRA